MEEETNPELEVLEKQNLLENEIKQGAIDAESSDDNIKTVTFSDPEVAEIQPKVDSKIKIVGIIKKEDRKPGVSNVIARHCLDKKEWLNLLATPSPKYLQGEKKYDGSSVRHHKLAQPPRCKLVNTLRERGAVLPIALVDRLINILENDEHYSLDEVEELFKGEKIVKKKQLKKLECRGIAKPIYIDESPKISKEAVMCQYKMAETFVKSILAQKSAELRDDVDDLIEIIQKRLIAIVHMDNAKLDEDESSYQQIRFLSKLIANWMVGIMEEAAVSNEEDLKRLQEERRRKFEHDSDDDSDDDDDEEFTEFKLADHLDQTEDEVDDIDEDDDEAKINNDGDDVDVDDHGIDDKSIEIGQVEENVPEANVNDENENGKNENIEKKTEDEQDHDDKINEGEIAAEE